jgi:glycerate 2-kinase
MTKWSHPVSVQPQFTDHIAHLAEIRQSILTAADPKLAVTHNLALHGSTLTVGTHEIHIKSTTRIFLVAAGKASAAMSLAALDVLGARIVKGVATVPPGSRAHLPSHISSINAGHPLPDEGSLKAGLAAKSMLAETKPDDLVLTLISGGGSAMLEHPVSGVGLDDLRAINNLLLRSGAPIESTNTVRRALSLIKAGGLVRMASPARVVSLIMSDVVGDRLSVIASGPTVLWRRSGRKTKVAPTIPLSPIDILKHYNIWASAPENVRFALSQPSATPPRARRPINILIGCNRFVVEAAAARAASLGFKQRLITTRMRGEARDVGLRYGMTLRRAKGPACLLMGGETTVTVRGEGKGGRNQELALAAALALENTSDVAVMSMATDGIDGPTDAAGAIITGATVPAARVLGINPERSLEQNDAYPLLEAIDSLLIIGPTGTNLNDVVVGLTYR